MKLCTVNILASIFCFLFVTIFGSASLSAQIIWSKVEADPYTNVAFSHSGSILALGRQDGNTSDFLNSADGTLIRAFESRHNAVNAIVFTQDDQSIITGEGGSGESLSINVWSVSEGIRLVRQIGHENGTTAVSASPDGQYVVTCGRFSREIRVSHVPEMALVTDIPNDDPAIPGIAARVKDVKFSPDGRYIAQGDAHGIKFRDPFSGTILLSIPTAQEVYSISFNPGGTLIAGAIPEEHAIKLWRTSDGALVKTLAIDTEFDFPVISFSPDGNFLAAGYAIGDAGALEFWSSAKWTVTSLENKSGAVHSLAFSPDSRRIAYTQFDGQVVMASAPKFRGRI
jgi:WD40 repeat protein